MPTLSPQPTVIEAAGNKPKVIQEFIGRVNAVMDRFVHFQFGGNLQFVDHGHEAVLAAVRTAAPGDDRRLLVLANFDTSHGHRLSS